ncbi:MAG: glycosyltransferase family 2 protein [Pseudonocardiaceae bacterium]
MSFDRPAVITVLVPPNGALVPKDHLLSLADGFRYVYLAKIRVVDNASADDSITIAERFFYLPPRVHQNGVNASFSAAINVAVRELSSLP